MHSYAIIQQSALSLLGGFMLTADMEVASFASDCSASAMLFNDLDWMITRIEGDLFDWYVLLAEV